MSSTNDTPMTRFLFAILKQKDLKDIDWNQVAHDPILTQEISNGHAARMRYSRFRSAMLGLEPTRRKTPSASKSKVSKPKKDTKVKKKDDASDSDTCVKGEIIKAERMKQDPCAELDSLHMVPTVPSPRVKQERIQPLTTAMPEASTTAGHTQFHNRLMTPCSDADSMNVNELLDSTYDYSGASCGHDASTPWSHSASPYQAFDMGYTMAYDDFCSHMPDEMLEQHPGDAVKHEDWSMHEY